MGKIALVCVDYKSEDETKRFINNVLGMSQHVSVILVCNSGSAQFSNYLDNKRVHIYDFETNLGYMQGAQQALKLFFTDNYIPEWVILSNTDIEFISSDFFERLKNDERHDSIVAPDIITIDGVHQNPFLVGRCSKAKLRFLNFVYTYTFVFVMYSLLSFLKKKLARKIKDHELESGLIYAPHGAFVVFGRKYFELGNDLMHPCFLYGEELLIAERARVSGISILFDSSYKILHREHVVTAGINNSNKKKYLKDSIYFVLKNYF